MMLGRVVVLPEYRGKGLGRQAVMEGRRSGRLLSAVQKPCWKAGIQPSVSTRSWGYAAYLTE